LTLEQRIRTEIEAHIRSGAWRPGYRIPFEHELVVQYGCSRATVSKALEGLARAGLIERRRKAGSFVAHPQVHAAVLEVPDLADMIAERGEEYRWELRNRRMVTSGSNAAGMSGPTLLVEGIHCAGGEPFGVEHRLISLATVPSAEQESFADLAPGTWLLGHVPWTDARHRIRAVSAGRALAKELELGPHTACLQVERWTWRTGDAVTYVRQVFPGDRYDLVAEFKPGEMR
jgi:GntR family histidine utilization transcriptional repressor